MEYTFAPTPIRANYLGSQALNPLQGISYFKRIYHNLNFYNLNNDATNYSLFYLFLNSFTSYGGINVLSDGVANTRLVFPPDIFNLAAILKLTCFGFWDNTNLGYKTFKLFALDNEDGTVVGGDTLITDQEADLDDFGSTGSLGAFKLEMLHNFAIEPETGTLLSNAVATLTYSNLNSTEGVSHVIKRIDAGLNSFDPKLATRLLVQLQNSVASSSEVVLIYGLFVEIA